MNSADRDDPTIEMLRFLRSVSPEPMPDDLADELDEGAIAERLRQLAGSDDAWIAQVREHESWVGHAIERLNGSELEHARRLTQPLGCLLDELTEKAADLGLLGGLARFLLDRRGDLEPAERDLFLDALHDAGAAGARAWARIDQARCLLGTIDRGGDA